MNEEPRYTLLEAQQKLSENECAQRGHDYEIVVRMGKNAPNQVLCSRCGLSWKVSE